MADKFTGGDLPDYFRLKPLKAAKVSEISEAVSSSSAHEKERVNFHIGNPVTEKKLNELFESIVFQHQEESLDTEKAELIRHTLKRSVPYSPRGGFDRKKPDSSALIIHQWLTENQQEPLEYELGQTTGKREFHFQSGGISESLRVFFRSLSTYSATLPAEILTWDVEIPDYLMNEQGLNIHPIPTGKSQWLTSLSSCLSENLDRPVFLLLGQVLKESERRELREMCLKYKLFIVEINNAPNHLSIAREAGLKNRVVRFIEPSAIHPSLKNLSIIITAGNSDFLDVMESVHFELKGTPSTSEMILLAHLAGPYINQNFVLSKTDLNNKTLQPPIHMPSDALTSASEKLSFSVDKALNVCTDFIEQQTSRAQENIYRFENHVSSAMTRWTGLRDPFQSMTLNELAEQFFTGVREVNYSKDLEKAFTSVFTDTHPEYKPENCDIVSGSSRTALSILGFHCGISEVIAPDLGWTYHHCFPSVISVPLGAELTLDKEAILKKVREKTENNPHWKKHGAVILNTPHNASGKIYNKNELKALLKALLLMKIMIIDDLSYENIHPRTDLKGNSTLKQLTNELVESGTIKAEHGNFLITVHSLSKTDCYAGARLAVAEIPIKPLQKRFREILLHISPNSFAIFLSYLFYRNGKEAVESFWLKRNTVFALRMKALEDAVSEFPVERNQFGLNIIPPEGSMYPRLEVEHLPQGLSLEWLSTGLAARGIGLVPLTTFSRTETGYELARKAFRLSLGGSDSHSVLKQKMRKVLIDLNRIIAEESALYTTYTLQEPSILKTITPQNDIFTLIRSSALKQFSKMKHQVKTKDSQSLFFQERWEKHLRLRLESMKTRMNEKWTLKEHALVEIRKDGGQALINTLKKEFYKESISDRERLFKERLFDRTVHPTQMYSLTVDILTDELTKKILCNHTLDKQFFTHMGQELVREYSGITVSISSKDEADEVICDLKAMIHAEIRGHWMHNTRLDTLLSFWGDWDGSTRPSGQGHRLVASVLQENILDMAVLVEHLSSADHNASFSPSLLNEIKTFRKQKKRFRQLLDNITDLTHQLEKRYQGLLPSRLNPGFLKKLGMTLKLVSDPITSILEHNDRLERKMQVLREKRKEQLEKFFSLNKRLRKELHENLHLLKNNLHRDTLINEFAFYRDKLKRFVLTPRIHQKTIQDMDTFTIDRTVQNIMEINDISGAYGNPGMVMALQVSMSTDPEALISLDRKFIAEKNRLALNTDKNHLPSIRLVPLFEEKTAVENLESYLNRLWNYSETTRNMDQETGSRFSQIICELFVAGSDLSQQLSQSAGAALYRQAKYTTIKWMAERGLAEDVRIKLGSGEPMQRQGGYYDPDSGKKTLYSPDSQKTRYWLKQSLPESSQKAFEYARSPLRGIMSGGEFRTFQSNVSEQLRQLPDQERAQILYHIKKSKTRSEQAVGRAVQPMLNTRLNTQKKEIKELERMIAGKVHPLTSRFIDLTSQYFRQILYGSDEDLVGIHAISYFISRTTPPLRDRPVVRPVRHSGINKSMQVVDQLKEMVPLSSHGSMLRAIGHNRAQTVVLGVNQLTTGLFRALSEILAEFSNREEGRVVISDRILPILPVRDILHTLRLFHDSSLFYASELENLFPSGSTAFHILKEDHYAIKRFTGQLQKELVRKQGLKVSDFFEGKRFKPELAPLFRPDLAVLLQKDIFNTDIQILLKDVHGPVDTQWKKEVEDLLNIRIHVEQLRKTIWDLIRQPIRNQVSSFVKVADAISSMTKGENGLSTIQSMSSPSIREMATGIEKSLALESDESLRHFLQAAVHYLTGMAGQSGKVPVEVIRVLRDVKQILRIEEQALGQEDQKLFRFYLLEIGRITGENG